MHLSDARELTGEDITTPPSQSYVEYQGMLSSSLIHYIIFFPSAPEILLKQSVSTATDMWGVGVMLYTL